jgi:heme/copper-type cytochrome/quinol oxidase subunit 4
MSIDNDTHATSSDGDAVSQLQHDDLHSHEISDKTYILIALFLAVLTAMEVAVTEIAGMPDVLLVPSLLLMMAIKFFVVVSYFMHLKHDAAIFKFGFYIGLAGAVVLYSVMLTTFHFFID